MLFEKLPVGNLFNSIDRDGTGQGLDLKIIDKLGNIKKPIILSGVLVIISILLKFLILAKLVLFHIKPLNFVGDGLKNLREELINKKIDLPS